MLQGPPERDRCVVVRAGFGTLAGHFNHLVRPHITAAITAWYVVWMRTTARDRIRRHLVQRGASVRRPHPTSHWCSPRMRTRGSQRYSARPYDAGVRSTPFSTSRAVATVCRASLKRPA